MVELLSELVGLTLIVLVALVAIGHLALLPNGSIAWELHLRRHHSAQLEGPGVQQG